MAQVCVWGGSTSKLTHVAVGRIDFLAGCWTEGLQSSLYIAWRPSLPHGPFHRGACNRAPGFHQREQARKSEREHPG